MPDPNDELLTLLRAVAAGLDRIGAALGRLSQPSAGRGGPPAVHYHHAEMRLSSGPWSQGGGGGGVT